MRRIGLYLTIIFLFTSPIKLKCQGSLDSASVILENLFGRLTNNYNNVSRIQINDSINEVIDWYVRTDTIFNHKFETMRYLGQITSRDSIIKIVTWNLVLENSPGKYYCYLIKKGDKGEVNKVYFLSTRYNEATLKTDTTYSNSDWYGALYYDLQPYNEGVKNFWVVLGIDYGNPLISRKIIDVMELCDDGSITFGKKWFVAGDKTSYRVVMEYASNAAISLRFASEKSIVFDHLVPFTPSQVNNRQFYGPDYSTDAYNLDNGKWTFRINVDARNRE